MSNQTMSEQVNENEFLDEILEEEEFNKLTDYETNLALYHPELNQISTEELNALLKVVKNEEGIIIDPFHKTLPVLTKYEKTRILGLRVKQLDIGSKPLLNSYEFENIIDNYLIAKKELNSKLLPFIIRRPLPDGKSEYWRLQDLEILSYE